MNPLQHCGKGLLAAASGSSGCLTGSEPLALLPLDYRGVKERGVLLAEHGVTQKPRVYFRINYLGEWQRTSQFLAMLYALHLQCGKKNTHL